MLLLYPGENDIKHGAHLSQVMSAIRQIEALVAEREIGNLLVAEAVGQGGPVVEGGVDDLVARESALSVRDRDVADLAAPAFVQGQRQAVRRERGGGALGHHGPRGGCSPAARG